MQFRSYRRVLLRQGPRPDPLFAEADGPAASASARPTRTSGGAVNKDTKRTGGTLELIEEEVMGAEGCWSVQGYRVDSRPRLLPGTMLTLSADCAHALMTFAKEARIYAEVGLLCGKGCQTRYRAQATDVTRITDSSVSGRRGQLQVLEEGLCPLATYHSRSRLWHASRSTRRRTTLLPKVCKAHGVEITPIELFVATNTKVGPAMILE